MPLAYTNYEMFYLHRAWPPFWINGFPTLDPQVPGGRRWYALAGELLQDAPWPDYLPAWMHPDATVAYLQTFKKIGEEEHWACDSIPYRYEPYGQPPPSQLEYEFEPGTFNPLNYDPFEPERKTRAHVMMRVRTMVRWRAALLQARYLTVRCTHFGWNPTQTALYPDYDMRIGYSSISMWYHVNRYLREHGDAKAMVEADPDVIAAGAAMDGIIQRFQELVGISGYNAPTVVSGNRFPVPKRWWGGNLDVRKKFTFGTEDPDADELTFADEFREQAALFRKAVGRVVSAHSCVHRSVYRADELGYDGVPVDPYEHS